MGGTAITPHPRRCSVLQRVPMGAWQPMTVENQSTAPIFAEAGPRGVVPLLLLRPAEAMGPLPSVGVLHGTGGRKEDLMEHLRRYARRGFLAWAIDRRIVAGGGC